MTRDNDENETRFNVTTRLTNNFTAVQVTDAEVVIQTHKENPSLVTTIVTAPLTLTLEETRSIIASTTARSSEQVAARTAIFRIS